LNALKWLGGIGVGRSALGVRASPRTEKKFGSNLQGKVVNAFPAEQKIGEIWTVGVI